MPTPFEEYLVANASKDWLARTGLTTADDLLRVLGGTRPVSQAEGVPAAPGQNDLWDAVFASVILRKYALATPDWSAAFPPERIVTALRNHRGIVEGPAWQVRKNLYLLLVETTPVAHDEVHAMALEEGVAPVVYRDVLPAADLYVMKCYGTSPREYWSQHAPKDQQRR